MRVKFDNYQTQIIVGIRNRCHRGFFVLIPCFKLFALNFQQFNTVDFGTLPASTSFKKPPNADSSERFLPFHAEMPKSSNRSDRIKLFSLQNFSVASICRRYESFDDCFRLLNRK